MTWRDPSGLMRVKGAHDQPIFVHRNDADSSPSNPHGHVGSPNSKTKVDVNNGKIFQGTRPTGDALSRRGLSILRSALKKAGLLGLLIKAGEFATAPNAEALGDLLDPGAIISGELSSDDFIPLPPDNGGCL